MLPPPPQASTPPAPPDPPDAADAAFSHIDTYDSLVFEGGGIKGVAYVEFLRTVVETRPKFIEQMRNFAGTSIGALVAGLLASGKSVDEIEGTISKIMLVDMQGDPDAFRKKTKEKCGSIYYLLCCSFCCCLRTPNFIRSIRSARNTAKRYGAFKRTAIEGFMRELFRTTAPKKNGGGKGGSPERNLLFEDLEKNLVVTAINLNTHEVVYFSNALTPLVPVYKAIVSSMCLPFVFEAMPYDFNPQYEQKHHLLIDGGILINFPVKVFDAENPHDGVQATTKNSSVIGVRLDSPEDLQFLSRTADEPITGLKEFVSEFVDTVGYNSKFNIRDDDRTREIYTKKYKMDDLELDKAKISDLYLAGRTAAEKFLSEEKAKSDAK